MLFFQGLPLHADDMELATVGRCYFAVEERVGTRAPVLRLQRQFPRDAKGRPQVDGVLCSPASPEEVHALVDALAQGPLNAGQEDYLVRLTAAAGGTVLEG